MDNVSVQEKPLQRRGVFTQQNAPLKRNIPKKRKFSFKKLALPLLPKISLKNKKLNKKVLIPSAAVFVILIGIGGYVLWQNNFFQQDPAITYAKQVQTMTANVSKYTTLPQDEDPVTATVTDKNVLPHEAFFANAQDGDKILMYKKNKKAILYRPSTKEVIAVAKLDFQDGSSTAVQQQATVTGSTAAVAGASTSAAVSPEVSSVMPSQPVTPQPYRPQGKILVEPQQ